MGTSEYVRSATYLVLRAKCWFTVSDSLIVFFQVQADEIRQGPFGKRAFSSSQLE